MKTSAPPKSSVNNVLKGIKNDEFYVSEISLLYKHGYKEMTVDIDAAEFDIDKRYTIQKTTIPAKKRGNLSKYAGKKVNIVVKGITRNGPRASFYIKER